MLVPPVLAEAPPQPVRLEQNIDGLSVVVGKDNGRPEFDPPGLVEGRDHANAIGPASTALLASTSERLASLAAIVIFEVHELATPAGQLRGRVVDLLATGLLMTCEAPGFHGQLPSLTHQVPDALSSLRPVDRLVSKGRALFDEGFRFNATSSLEHHRIGHQGHQISRLRKANDAVFVLEPRQDSVLRSQLDAALVAQDLGRLDGWWQRENLQPRGVQEFLGHRADDRTFSLLGQPMPGQRRIGT